MMESQRRRWGYVEIMGLGLILAATAWQVFLEDATVVIKRDAAFYDVERKLDSIWAQLGPMIDPERVTAEAYVDANSKWKIAGRGYPELERQLTAFTWIRFGVFLFGSILTVVAKWPRLTAQPHSTAV